MAINLTARALLLSQKRNVVPNLILEIDGLPTIYTAIETLEVARYDSGLFYDTPGLIYDGLTAIDAQETVISLGGTTNTITQQLLQDKGATSSVGVFSIELIDKAGAISEIVSPGVVLAEILGVRARVYINFEGGSHPEDSVLIHKGIIDNVDPMAVSVKLSIAHAEQIKRQDLFIQAQNLLNGAIDNIQTTITVDSTDLFINQSLPELESYIRIDDEIIKYTGTTATDFTGCSRGQLNTLASAHDDDSEVLSFYRLQDGAIDMALKLMLSQADPTSGVDIQHIGAKTPSELDSSAVSFDLLNVQDRYGLVLGDFLSITGSGIGGNNVVNAAIIGFGTTNIGSFVLTDQTFSLEADSPALASFKSKYDVLPEGMGMRMEDVDVERHESLLARFPVSIPNYDFYLKDTINAKDFISQELYYPAGLYSLPRKSKASVGLTLPGIAEGAPIILDERNVVSPSSLKSNRSINKNFYNAVVVKYNEDSIEDRFLSGAITFSAGSQNRIKNTGNRPFTVISKGLRPGAGTDTLITTNSRRWLERYEFAAESVSQVNLLFKDGFKVEVGDVVAFGSPSLKMTDLSSGDRNRLPKLFEVVNKSLNLKTGEVRIDILATQFQLNGRYGVFSPSSKVGVGSTTTNIVIKDSFSTVFPEIEKDKWNNFVGEEILVHSVDWTFQETVTLVRFSSGNDYIMEVSPALSAPPAENYIIDIPYYPNNTDASDDSIYKLLFAHFDPEVDVVTGVSNFEFTVAAGDVGKFFVGSIVRVNNPSYSNYSPETTVTVIDGVNITVEDDLGFTPVVGDKVNLIGFKDLGKPYRLL